MATLLGKITADFQTSLSTDIAVAGTTATLSSATDDDGVALPSGRYFFTLDNSNSSKEHISCDLVGTALTNIKSVSRQGVETAGVVRKHRIGASVTLTDFAHLKFINDLVSGASQLNALAPLGYDDAPSSLAGNQLATVTYVLGVVNGGTVTFDKQVISNQTSGEALTVNDIVYFKESDALWYKADADIVATFNQLQLGVAQATVGIGETVAVAISGPVGGFSGLTAGSKYYLSNTAGGVSSTAGTTAVFLGWALNTTTLVFVPERNGALNGSQGVPSSANTFITEDNVSVGDTVGQSQTTQDSSSTVGEASTTGLRNKLAQSFKPTKTKIRGVNLYKSADTGTFTGTVTVSIQADSSGSPSGTALATQTITNSAWLAKSAGEIEVLFASEYASLVAGDTYWIVIQTSTADSSNRPNIGINTAGGYANGSVKYNNATDGWVAVGTIDLYFKTLLGNASQVVKTNISGKIESNFYDITEMPIPAYQQALSWSVGSADTRASGSNQDGSVIYALHTTGAEDLYRWERDANTGAYILTHKVSITAVIPSSDSGAIIQIGSYIYLFGNDGTNVKATRFLAVDLTGEQSMTVPTVASTSITNAWTDGVYAYLVSGSAQTTSHKWSLSGTVFSAVSTASVTTNTFGDKDSASMFDGEVVYFFEQSRTASSAVHKLTTINGSTFTSTTYIGDEIFQYSDTNYGAFIINIDKSRMYLGVSSVIYDETSAVKEHIILIPVTKP